MKPSKGEIGKELKKEIDKGYSIERISTWACNLFVVIRNENSSELDDILRLISLMDAGPEFELSKEELTQLADKLIAEGEKEDLGNPIPEIKEVAQSIGDDWLMCPICQEAWEEFSKFGMVRCPKCNNKLHNPKFNPVGRMP